MTEYRKATAADYENIIRFSNLVFAPQEPEDVSKTSYFPRLLPKLYQNPETAPMHRLVLRDDVKTCGGIVGCVGLFPLPMTVAGRTLNAVGIGTVGVSAPYRGEGYMKKLLSDAVAEAKDGGADLMILSGLRHRYRHFGFEFAGENPVFTVDAHGMRHLFGAEAYFGYTFRPLSQDDGAAVQWVDAKRTGSPAYVHVPREVAIRQMCSMGATPTGIYNKDGNLCGAMVFREKQWRAICDFVLDEVPEAGHVLNDFFRFEKENGDSITIERTPIWDKELLAALCGVCSQMQLGHLENVRILRYKPTIEAYLALKARFAPLYDGEFVAAFESETLCIRVQNGVPSVDVTDREPEIRLSAPEAVGFLFGHEAILSAYPRPLPAAVRSWFPLPFHLRAADCV